MLELYNGLLGSPADYVRRGDVASRVEPRKPRFHVTKDGPNPVLSLNYEAVVCSSPIFVSPCILGSWTSVGVFRNQ
jgi:hypothetical protein